MPSKKGGNKTSNSSNDSKDSKDSKDSNGEVHHLSDRLSSRIVLPGSLGEINLVCSEAYAKSPEFLIDSGATHHLVFDRDSLQNITQLNRPITFGLADSKANLHSYEKGEVCLRSNDTDIIIKDVHHVPGSRINILSAGYLKGQGWSVDFDRLQACRGKDSLKFIEKGVLPYLKADKKDTAPLISVTEALSPLHQEHRRLGHIGRTKLLELAAEGVLNYGVDVLKADSFRLSDCETCHKSKATRYPKDGVSPRGHRDCELVHVDIAGQFIPSAAGNAFYTLMIDDYSKVMSVVPTKTKGEAFIHLKAFIQRLERQLGEKVRFIRSDGGGEFDSGPARFWYTQTGIQHQITPHYTPELNGVVERANRTVKEMIYAMVGGTPMGHSVWDHAARYTSVILMKTSVGYDNVSAWTKITGREINIESIREFGELCFVQIPQEIRPKSNFDIGKAVVARLLGQDEGISGWIVRIEHSGNIIHSRDVQTATGMRLDTPLATPISRPTLPSTVPVRPTTPPEASLPPIKAVPDPVTEIVLDLSPQRENTPENVTQLEDVPEPASISIDNDPPTQIEPVPEPAPVATRVQPSRMVKHVHFMEDIKAGNHHHGENARTANLASEAAFLHSISMDEDEPRTALQALSSKEGNQWLQAMQIELDNLESKGTWTETTLPAGRKAIGCRWVFKRKRDSEGKVAKYKARIVAKGFSQQP